MKDLKLRTVHTATNGTSVRANSEKFGWEGVFSDGTGNCQLSIMYGIDDLLNIRNQGSKIDIEAILLKMCAKHNKPLILIDVDTDLVDLFYKLLKEDVNIKTYMKNDFISTNESDRTIIIFQLLKFK